MNIASLIKCVFHANKDFVLKRTRIILVYGTVQIVICFEVILRTVHILPFPDAPQQELLITEAQLSLPGKNLDAHNQLLLLCI